MTGGTLRGSNYALVGSGAEQSLHGLRVSRAFLSGSGLTAERGLSTSNMLSASVDRALVQAAAEVVVLADHTKLGADTMFQTVPTDIITRLVTDEPPPHDDRAEAELQALADHGVQVTVAGGSGAGGEPLPETRPAPPERGRRDVPMPSPRRGGTPPGATPPTQLRASGVSPRVADLAPVAARRSAGSPVRRVREGRGPRGGAAC